MFQSSDFRLSSFLVLYFDCFAWFCVVGFCADFGLSSCSLSVGPQNRLRRQTKMTISTTIATDSKPIRKKGQTGVLDWELAQIACVSLSLGLVDSSDGGKTDLKAETNTHLYTHSCEDCEILIISICNIHCMDKKFRDSKEKKKKINRK